MSDEFVLRWMVPILLTAEAAGPRLVLSSRSVVRDYEYEMLMM